MLAKTTHRADNSARDKLLFLQDSVLSPVFSELLNHAHLRKALHRTPASTPSFGTARGVAFVGVRPLFSRPRRVGAGACAETPGDAETAATEIPDDQQVAETDPPILLEEVPNRAETTNAELATLLPRDSSRQTLERVGGETDLVLKEVESHLAKTRQMLAGRPNLPHSAKVLGPTQRDA